MNVFCQICKEYHFEQTDGCCCVNGHFVCWEECFKDYVGSALKIGAIQGFTDEEGNLLCPEVKCKKPYDLQSACIQGAPSDVFNRLQELKIMILTEKRVKEALEMAERKRKAEEARIAAIDNKIEQEAERLRMRIVNDILTLCCPRANCRTAFTDFDGCFALTCWACSCKFCAWCLKDCGTADVHQHVARCVENQANRNVFSTEAAFKTHHMKRRKAAVWRLLADQSTEVRDRVKLLMRRDLADLGITLGTQPTEAPKAFQPHPPPPQNDPNRNNRRNNNQNNRNDRNYDNNRNNHNNHNIPPVAAPPPARRHREPPRQRRQAPQVPQEVPYYEQPRPPPLARHLPPRQIYDKNNPFTFIIPIVVCVVLVLGQYYCGMMSAIAKLLFHCSVWSAKVWYFILSYALYYGFWGTNYALIAIGHMLYWSAIAVGHIAFYVGSAACSLLFLLFFG